MANLQNIINNRICAIILPGKSIEELESKIEEFKNYDLCWCGINMFDIVEDNILSKINKHLSVCIDCSSVKNELNYDKYVRADRILKVFRRQEDNVMLTSSKLLEDLMKAKREDVAECCGGKFIKIEDYLLYNVPNSLTILLLYLARFGAKKIIMFGADGYPMHLDSKKSLYSYYRQDLIASDRSVAFDDVTASGLHSDTYAFDRQFLDLYEAYSKMYDFSKCDIINCSPISLLTCFPKTDYNSIHNHIKS